MKRILICVLLLFCAATLFAADQWWILVRDYEGYGLRTVYRVLGPFQSAELCRLAGHDFAPAEARFWNDQQKAEHEEYERQAEIRARSEFLNRIAEARKLMKLEKDGHLRVEKDRSSCEQHFVHVDPVTGEEVDEGSSGQWISSCVSIDAGGFSSRPVTGCVKTIDPELLR